MQVAELGEVALIARLRRLFDRPLPHLTVANGDDAACWTTRGQTVATVDSIVEGVDWLGGLTPADAIGHRAAAVNLSDLAAMGATPTALLLALELPSDAEVDAVLGAAAGLSALADRHGTAVVGGDVGLCAGPQRWSLTALGQLSGEPLRRSAAQVGDRIWLIGDVGRAALGLELLRAAGAVQDVRGSWAQDCLRHHLYPQPLVQAGRALQASGLRIAAIDISDGLGLDARRLAAASGVGLALALDEPVWLREEGAETCARLGLDWRQACASGGDDYALLVAAAAGVDIAALLQTAGVEDVAQAIGFARADADHSVSLRVGGLDVAPAGWLHGR